MSAYSSACCIKPYINCFIQTTPPLVNTISQVSPPTSAKTSQPTSSGNSTFVHNSSSSEDWYQIAGCVSPVSEFQIGILANGYALPVPPKASSRIQIISLDSLTTYACFDRTALDCAVVTALYFLVLGAFFVSSVVEIGCSLSLAATFWWLHSLISCVWGVVISSAGW